MHRHRFRSSVIALVIALVAASVAVVADPAVASASAWVKQGVSGHAYYWQAGSC